MRLSSILHVVRALLAAGTLCALGTWFLWTQYPRQVQRQDGTWRWTYRKDYEGRHRSGALALSEGDLEGGVRILEALAADLEPIRKKDRLDNIKRQTLSNLMTAHALEGDMARAALFADELAEFDDRDLGHAVARALLFERVPGREHETEEILSGLLKRLPRLHAASTAYSAYLLRHDRPGEAVDVTLRAVDEGLAEILLDGWRGFWDVGDGFALARSKDLVLEPTRNPSEYGFSMRIPAGESDLGFIRIDPPPRAIFRIAKCELDFVAGEIVEVLDGLQSHVEGQGVHAVDGVLFVEGASDPWISYRVPESLRRARGVTVRFQGTIEPVLPRAMRELARDEERLRTVREWFEERDRTSDYERFLELARA